MKKPCSKKWCTERKDNRINDTEKNKKHSCMNTAKKNTPIILEVFQRQKQPSN